MLTRLSGANFSIATSVWKKKVSWISHKMFQNLFPVLTMVIKHLPKVLTIPTACARNIQNTRNLKSTSDKATCRRTDLVKRAMLQYDTVHVLEQISGVLNRNRDASSTGL